MSARLNLRAQHVVAGHGSVAALVLRHHGRLRQTRCRVQDEGAGTRLTLEHGRAAARKAGRAGVTLRLSEPAGREPPVVVS